MNRRSFFRNSIGALFCVALEHNKILCDIVNSIPKKSMDVLLYAVQTKWGDWKIKATKWTNLNKEILKNTEYNVDTFTPLGIFDNSEIKEKQTLFAKQYKAVNSLHSVDHYQCTINGNNYPVSKQATFKSRSDGGKTRVIQNKKSGYWDEMHKKYSSENGKKNIKYTKTKYALLAQKNSATWTFEQLKEDGTIVKTYRGKKSFDNTIYNFSSVRYHCDTKTLYKGYYWKIKTKTNKNHKKSAWTKESIKKAAKECSYKAEFRRKYQQAYFLSKRLGIFDSITKHMKRPKTKNQYTKNLVDSK
jgi:hypothetical protein